MTFPRILWALPFALAMTFSGCGGPTLFDSSMSRVDAIDLWVTPVRWEYDEGNEFKKTSEHFAVRVEDRNGRYQRLSTDDPNIALFVDETPVEADPALILTPGRKLVTVNYGNLSAIYNIRVWKEGESPGTSGDSGSSGGTSIEIRINWAE
ncbi:MAG: hypothetical protein LBU18_05205 [Treponema sp.]|nr:hypothetical protein [Treponema sp.]